MLVGGNVVSWYSIPGFCVHWILYNYPEYNLEYVAVLVQQRICGDIRAGGVTEQDRIWASRLSWPHNLCVLGAVCQDPGPEEHCLGLYCVSVGLYCV